MAFDAFLKIDGIGGESTDGQHSDWIEVSSFSWGVNQASNGVGAGASAGRAQVHDFSFTKSVGKSSPQLMQAAASGQHLNKAVLACRNAGTTDPDYLTITFSNVLISGFVEGGHAESQDEPTPSEQISFNFQKVKLAFTPQNADGQPGTPSTGEATVGSAD
jgi:type VI secretion system secreted protein Hcp